MNTITEESINIPAFMATTRLKVLFLENGMPEETFLEYHPIYAKIYGFVGKLLNKFLSY